MTLLYVFIVVAIGIVSSFCVVALRHLFEYTDKLSQRLETLEQEEIDCVEELVGEPAEWPDNEDEDR